MKSTHSEEAQKVLVMIQLDSYRLMERIIKRKEEYVHRFTLSRTRNHFPDIFENKFQKMLPGELKNLSEDLLFLTDSYYGLVDDLYWYFKQTEDMGVAIEDHLSLSLKEIIKAFDKLSLYLKAEIRGEK